MIILENMSLTERLNKGSTKESGQMKSNHQPDVYLITGDDHANPWRSTDLDREDEYAPLWH